MLILTRRLEDPDPKINALAYKAIRAAFKAAEGRVGKACKILRISRSQYSYWRSKHPRVLVLERETQKEYGCVPLNRRREPSPKKRKKSRK